MSSVFVDAVIKCLVGVLDSPVEVPLPEGGRIVWLCWSGGSVVVGVDAVGGPPDGDFTDEFDVWVAARWRPNWLDAVVAGVVLNVLGEVGDQVGSLGQVLAPIGVVIDRLWDSG
jgi:hypothetical protein